MSRYKRITTEAEVEVDIFEAMDSLSDKELDEYIQTRSKENSYALKERLAEEAVNLLISNKDYLDQLSLDKLKLNCGDLL
jgi:hypothetical protein